MTGCIVGRGQYSGLHRGRATSGAGEHGRSNWHKGKDRANDGSVCADVEIVIRGKC